jgi:hypothetical protein
METENAALRTEVEALKKGKKAGPPTETIDVACRAWWDCLDANGKRIATRGWDEIPEEWKADYRRRMTAALQAAVGLP